MITVEMVDDQPVAIVPPMPADSEMTPDEFKEILKVIFGCDFGSKQCFSNYTGISYSTTMRMASGKKSVPRHIMILLNLLAWCRVQRGMNVWEMSNSYFTVESHLDEEE